MRSKCSYIFLTITLLVAICSCGEAEKKPELLEENAYTFADGQQVSVWRYPGDSKRLYCLADGTVLLAVDSRETLGETVTEYTSALEALSDTARETVAAACSAVLPELPITQYLEEAYSQYTKEGEQFQCDFVSRSLFPSGASKQALYITVQTAVSGTGGEEQQETLTWAFDRETGEKIDGWALYNVPKEEAKEALLGDYSAEGVSREELLAALRPEYIRLYPDRYEIAYTLEQGTAVALSGEYTPEVLAVLNDWAIPME